MADKSSIKAINKVTFRQRLIAYKRKPLSLLMLILVAVAAAISAAALIFIIAYVLIKGVPNLTPELFSLEYNSDNVSCMPSIINTVVLTLMTLLIAVPFGVGAAIYLAEYAKKGNKLVKIIRTMAETLAGIPSIVYGLFGMLFFVYALKWGYSLLAGSFTLAIMVLPTIMRTTEEALLTVPDSYREGSFGLGAGKLRTIFRIILPSAMPGILAGVILAVGRIVGETAALLYTYGSATGYAASPMSSGRSLAVHMYVLANEGLHTDQAWGTAVVLVALVFGINTLSAFIAKKLGSKKG
ncbi:MAG: phosphate ABC transporter permease PstA [Ruminococcus sp.]|nr:phosphate ABC transporter permease PstA [Ruminococcus sp.]